MPVTLRSRSPLETRLVEIRTIAVQLRLARAYLDEFRLSQSARRKFREYGMTMHSFGRVEISWILKFPFPERNLSQRAVLNELYLLSLSFVEAEIRYAFDWRVVGDGQTVGVEISLLWLVHPISFQEKYNSAILEKATAPRIKGGNVFSLSFSGSTISQQEG